MADATAAEVIQRVLEKLSVLETGETVEAEDSVKVGAVLVSVNEKLRDMEIAYWSDSAFPQSIKEDLAYYVGCHVAEDYRGTQGGERFRQANEARSLANLRAIVAPMKAVTSPTRATYF